MNKLLALTTMAILALLTIGCNTVMDKDAKQYMGWPVTIQLDPQ